MISKNGVRIRIVISLILFFLSGNQIVTGGLATLCGVVGVIELATALQRYSPVYELKPLINKSNKFKIVHSSYNLQGYKA